ncbi:MAG: putative lipid II flippase FtsW [Candidatus Auribacterota bacterium]|jgi:cell division protein FtsW|nr:putative lipid II flippase FtsW [Candidatus Auribacterota bacterium]
MKTILGIILSAVLCFVALSLVMVYSTSAIVAQDRFGCENFFLKKQLTWLGMGFLSFLLFSYCPYRILKPLAKVLLCISGVLLVLPMTGYFGHTAGGATRWLVMGPVRFQPSEFAKLAIIIYAADVLSRKQDEIKDFFKSLLFPSLLIGCMLLLILEQPDFGTTVLMGIIVMLLYFIAGIKVSYCLLFIFNGLVAGIVAIKMFPYRMKRIAAFLDPFADPKGSGFQIIQSFIALGSGGLFGVGLGQGKQKLFYLPEAHTDFIFAIIGEELGFVGTSVVCSMFLVLFLCGMLVAIKCRDPFGKLLATGITLMLGVQSVINMCVVTGLLPTKGIALPFLSFGGSNLMTNFIAIGILMNIGMRGNEKVVSNIIKHRDANQSGRNTPVRSLARV